MRRNQVITCPRCGKEYLPSEIFIPKYILGTPSYIFRDESNKITNVEGIDPDTTEKYTCDNCSCKFVVNIKMSFDVKEDKYDFDVDTETKAKKLLVLNEN